MDDVDLWVGVVCEKTMEGSAMGQAGASIVADGFKRLRDGDRYWYEYAYPQ